ncbi:thioredoxin domain-containing protein [Nitrosophilus alvini]|uniref:thioredoxin domain-containing protein n=1 Tax=Nitrosophilus alvini TaxID=2714855 RepID=UPI0019097917|nr:thioredoxin domain-containing protein [Nitrosophilus alvini]
MKKVIIIFLTLLFSFAEEKHTNALIYEESPYLQQHAHNPVNWYPWGEEAFEKAKREHKPIFLSIGYSTCHWCHVMEKESFENEEIAELLNRYYIAIKVDKEEMPHLDKYYQKVYQLLHERGGGWPLTIILTEDMKPFFAATYIPPEDGYGVKGMKTILPLLAKEYKNNRKKIEITANAIVSLMKSVENMQTKTVLLDLGVAEKAVKEIEGYYDNIYKGFSKRIKFPESSRIRLLIDIYLATGNEKAFKMADETLSAMAKGGIYDQIEGAFFRYTTDRRWQIPHFEKMLYTNAELIELYTKMYILTKKPLYKKVVIETIAEIERRFENNSLYYSASDADTDGIEGGYFIYSFQDTLKYFQKRGFKKENAQKVLAYFGIVEDGNIDSEYSNPHINENIKIDEKTKKRAKRLLKELRFERNYPFIDKKVITAWNAMWIRAKLKASYIDKRYALQAFGSLERLLKKMYKNGTLYHQFRFPHEPSKEGLLEDYAYLISALIEAYENSFEEKYLKLAKKLADDAKSKFYTGEKWYLSAGDFKTVADINDSYYTAPLSIMIHNFLSLSSLSEDLKYLEDAKKILAKYSVMIDTNPSYYPEAARAVIRENRGDIILKSRAENLLRYKKESDEIKYPYLLLKPVKEEGYLACRTNTCFAYEKDFEKIKKRIENER